MPALQARSFGHSATTMRARKSKPGCTATAKSDLATQPETPEPEEPTTPVETLLLSVSEEERNKVIAAYKEGIPRREICSHLRWGSAKYSTIVKPVLDSYVEHQ